LAVLILTILVAIFGPMLTQFTPLEFAGLPHDPPSSEHWFGTTSAGEDGYSQFVYGMRASFVVGILGGGTAWLIGSLVGFTAGYRGGLVDEVLNMLTNVVLVIPTLALLIIVAGMT